MKVTFEELEKMGYESVTDYCRYLVETWDPFCTYNPKDDVKVYRGDMLCLTVKTIEEGAKIMPSNGKWAKYDKTRRKASRETS